MIVGNLERIKKAGKSVQSFKKTGIDSFTFSRHTGRPRMDSLHGASPTRTAAFPVDLMDEASTTKGERDVAHNVKGYSAMFAVHDQFNQATRDRLKAFCMGAGLARLLDDAGRTDEAVTTLVSLEKGFQGCAKQTEKPNQKSRDPNRWKGRRISRTRCQASVGCA
jgi:hypothetical protein